MASGAILHSQINAKDALICMHQEGTNTPLRVTKLQVYGGLHSTEVESAVAGDIVVLAGFKDVTIGDTICN